MRQDSVTLENPLERGHGPVRHRTGQARGHVQLPADLEIVSADGHYEIGEDIFFEGFPAAMKDKAPRVWFADGMWSTGYPDQGPTDPQALAAISEMKKVVFGLGAEGSSDLDIRMRDLSIEGIQQEIVYPNSLLGFIRQPDLAVQEQVYRIYNEHMADLGRRYPGRFHGVGVCSNWWDPAKARGAIRQIADLGLRTFIVPTANAGKAANGNPIGYGNKEMDVFWSEVAEVGLPVSFHVGENFSISGRGGLCISTMQTLAGFRKPFSELVFGGVFDRHPDLQIVFAEGGLHWVPSALQDAEHLIDVHRHVMDYVPKQRPSHYWHNNCYATFQTDPLGLGLMHYIGVDRVMWASDYPHNEGTHGYGWNAMQAVVDAVGADDGRKILGGTAKRLYKLD